jgi:hypothetical protein
MAGRDLFPEPPVAIDAHTSRQTVGQGSIYHGGLKMSMDPGTSALSLLLEPKSTAYFASCQSLHGIWEDSCSPASIRCKAFEIPRNEAYILVRRSDEG